MTLRVALVTHDYQLGGGVSTMTNFLYRVLRESGRFEPEIISLAHSASDSASVRLRSPATWRQGIQLLRGKCDGIPFVHFGAWFSELEFQRYRPRANLTEMLNGYDLVQFVVGAPPWMWAEVSLDCNDDTPRPWQPNPKSSSAAPVVALGHDPSGRTI